MNQPPPESLRVHGRFDAFYKSLLEEKKKKEKKEGKKKKKGRRPSAYVRISTNSSIIQTHAHC
jgi:hypothetical protein